MVKLRLAAIAAVPLLATLVSVDRTAADSSQGVGTVSQEVTSNNGARSSRHGFSNASLSDRYGFHARLFRINPAEPILGGSFPAVISGYYHFKGDGTLYGKDTTVMGTAFRVVDREYDGSYQVDADGTGTLALNISPTFQAQGRFVIVKGGEEIEIVFVPQDVNAWNLNAFTLKKQHTR